MTSNADLVNAFLDSLTTKLFSKKKDAIDNFSKTYFKTKPTFDKSLVQVLAPSPFHPFDCCLISFGFPVLPIYFNQIYPPYKSMLVSADSIIEPH